MADLIHVPDGCQGAYQSQGHSLGGPFPKPPPRVSRASTLHPGASLRQPSLGMDVRQYFTT